MAMTNLIANVNRGLERIENHIRGVGTPMQNPANVIDGIRGSLNIIWVTLQNITTERNQYQNLLNDSIWRVDDLRNQLNDSGNQNLRLQRLLDESRVQVERTMRERDVAIRGEIMLKESGIWLFWFIIMRKKNPVVGISHIRIKIGVFKNYCEKSLLNRYYVSRMLTIFNKISDSYRLMPKTR